MRLTGLSRQSTLEQRRELARRRRASSGTLAAAFPAVERVRVELNFQLPNGNAPSSQAHELYPPAPAYFEFTCPHGDCNGGFNLEAIARRLLQQASATAEGTLDCPGTRPAAGSPGVACGLSARYRVTAYYS